MQLCLLRETLAAVNTEAETALALQGLGSYPILQSGNDATRERWLPGRRERRRGGRVRALRARRRLGRRRAGARGADRTADGWTLHGEKTWISNAPEADVYTVFARTTPAPGRAG